MTPTHYAHTKIEPIKVINSINLGFNLGSAYKYLARAGYKGSKADDIKKAIDFIEYEIEQQTFFCNPDKLQVMDEIREIEFDNDLIISLLSAISLHYIYSDLNYLKDLKDNLESILQKSTETPTTKD